MAEPLVVSIPHQLGREEAVRRIKSGFGGAKAHFARARQELKKGGTVEARRLFNLAVAEGIAKSQSDRFEPALAKAETAERKKKQRADAAMGAMARQAYGKALRERYLDDNLDIKVTVSGKDSEKITLAFALFNDVWAHKVQKGDLLDEMQKLGFKRVDMTDNYDYHVHWNLR